MPQRFEPIALANTFNNWRLSHNDIASSLSKSANGQGDLNVSGLNFTANNLVVTKNVTANNFTASSNVKTQALTVSNFDLIRFQGGVGANGQFLKLKNSANGAMQWGNVDVVDFSELTGVIANTQFPTLLGISSNTTFSNTVTFASAFKLNTLTTTTILGR